ncbi:MAG: hypothetical protein ACRD9R_09825, partial [Pyrinomonadaceae bacterium]
MLEPGWASSQRFNSLRQLCALCVSAVRCVSRLRYLRQCLSVGIRVCLLLPAFVLLPAGFSSRAQTKDDKQTSPPNLHQWGAVTL